jgi:hypothetical protein
LIFDFDAAGADIKEMADRSIVDMRHPDQTLNILEQISKIQKPLIAGTFLNWNQKRKHESRGVV